MPKSGMRKCGMRKCAVCVHGTKLPRAGAPETRYGLGGDLEEPQEESHIIATAEHSRGGPYGIPHDLIPENVRLKFWAVCA